MVNWLVRKLDQFREVKILRRRSSKMGGGEQVDDAGLLLFAPPLLVMLLRRCGFRLLPLPKVGMEDRDEDMLVHRLAAIILLRRPLLDASKWLQLLDKSGNTMLSSKQLSQLRCRRGFCGDDSEDWLSQRCACCMRWWR